MPFPHVSIVVLSYNGRELTVDCVRSLLQTSYPNRRILVIDNASADDSVIALRESFREELAGGTIELVVNSSNLGFAAGNNIGISIAMRGGTDFILLLNNDTVVAPDFLDHLIQTMQENPDAGIAGPMIYYFEPPDRIWFAGTDVMLARGISRHRGIRERDVGQFSSTSECDAVTGCALLIRVDVIRKIGVLDTHYPLYSEDTDFCMRARRAGYRILMEPRAKVWHKISAATGGAFNWKKIRLRTWSNILFLLRHARWFHWFTIPWFQAAELVRVGMLWRRREL